MTYFRTPKNQVATVEETPPGGGGAESPAQFIKALKLYCDMESGLLGKSSEWTHPLRAGEKVSHAEIYHRIGYKYGRGQTFESDWMSWPVFREALEIERNFRSIEALGENHAASVALDSVCNLGLKYLARQLILSEAGLGNEVKFSNLMRDLPKMLRLKWEKEGEVASAGINMNFLTQNILSLQDPAARANAYRQLQKRLAERAADDLVAGEGDDADEEDIDEEG